MTTVTIPQATLKLLIEAARTQAEDIRSGMEQGYYNADDNAYIGKLETAIEEAASIRAVSTRDVGLTIGLKLQKRINLYDEECESEETAQVDFVDMSDPDNLSLELVNGQTFRIRVFAA